MEQNQEKRPGQKKDSESEESTSQTEEPEDLDRLDRIYKLIQAQGKAMMELTERIAETAKALEEVKAHQGKSDEAIIEVAKKVGAGGGGGGGGGGNILSQLLPLLQQRGPGPLEKIAMKGFLRNMAFTSLTTERLAKKQFGEAYTKMVKDMEAELAGSGKETEPGGE